MKESQKLTGRIYGSESWRDWSSDTPAVYPLGGEYFIEFFDAQNQLTGVVRDPLGLMPVYYTALNGNLRIYRTLLEAANALSQPTVNWDYIYSVMATDFTRLSESPFNEVYRIPPGHLLFRKNGKWITRTFFKSIEPRPAHNFYETFLSVIKERATAHPDFLISFSGGLDSSLLLSSLLTQGHLPWAATLIFDDPLASEEVALNAFERMWGNCFERIYAPSIASNIYNWQSHDLYLYNPTETLFIPILNRAREKNVADVWVGYGADEVFTLNSCLLKALILSGDWENFLKAFGQERQDQKSFSQSANSLLKELAPQKIKRILANVWPADNSPFPQVRKIQKQARARRVTRMRSNPIQNELNERLFSSGTIPFATEQSHELAHPRGVHFAYPFFDIRLIEMSLSFKAVDFYQNGLNKFTLRKSFEKILPKEITGSVSHQAYDDWILDVWAHQSDALKNQSHFALDRFDLVSPPQKFSDRLRLLYASQFDRPLER